MHSNSPNEAAPPPSPGTYALVLQAVDSLELAVGEGGRFGTMFIEPGVFS